MPLFFTGPDIGIPAIIPINGEGFISQWSVLTFTVNPLKLETGLRPNSAGIPYTLLL